MREQTLARQKQLGIVPADAELPPVNPIGTPETRQGPEGQPFPPLDVTRTWDSLSADENPPQLDTERSYVPAQVPAIRLVHQPVRGS